MKKSVFFAVITLFFVTLQISSVVADGGFIPYPGSYVQSGQQRAILFYEDNTETMIVTTNFKGDAEEFVWLLPTPSKPTVTKATEDAFLEIQKLTRPQYNDYRFNYDMVSDVASRNVGGVVVLETKKVDYYDISVLLATSKDDLVEWLNENDYNYPEEYSYVLEHYIQKGWYFTAVKISPESQGATGVEDDLREGHPTPLKLEFYTDKIVFPLKISSVDFSTSIQLSNNLYLNSQAIKNLENIGYDNLASEEGSQIFTEIISDVLGGVEYKDSVASDYPLIVSKSNYEQNIINEYCNYESCARSSLDGIFRSYFGSKGISLGYGNTYSSIPINLYVIADGKYEATGFNTQYASWIDKDDIESLGKDDEGNPLIEPEEDDFFITSLYRSIQRSQMDNDIYLDKAENNSKVNAGPESWQTFLYGLLIFVSLIFAWIFTPMGILFIVGIFILFLSQSHGARVFAWVAQGIALGLTFIVGLIFLIILISNGALGANYITNAFLIAFIFLVILMVSLIFVERRHNK